MYFKVNKKSILSLFLVVVMVTSLSLKIGAAAWDKYSQYIPAQTPVIKSHLRAAWISTVYNLDWPSSKTASIKDDTARIQATKDDLIKLLDKAVAMNMNAVFIQVRSTADAFYKSDLVPWSQYLTGTFGKDPGFDPLQFAIDECRKRNLEIHAWFNPYRVSTSTSEAVTSSLDIPKSVYKEHPEWIKVANNRYVVDPGIPEARKWVQDCVMEVVNKYDIDGVHFDDYFYYEAINNEMGDDTTYQKYNNGQFKSKADWRRNNTYLLVKELSQKINKAKPWVKFGISPSAIWRNKKDDPAGSNTNSTYTNYDKCYADTKKWVDEELIDYICPQIYFTYENPAAPYGELVEWWSNSVKGKNVHLYIGQALYRINEGNSTADKDFSVENGVAEMTRQLKHNATKQEVNGTVLFRMYNTFQSTMQQVTNTIQNDLWSTKTLVPVMPWKGGKAPQAPQTGKLSSQSNGIKLTWEDASSSTAYYAIYRYSANEKIDITADSSAKNLIATVRKNGTATQTYTDTSRKDPNGVVYFITALDRLHNQSGGLKLTYQSKYFKDVGQNIAWAIDSIDKLYEAGIVNGDGKGNFMPIHNTTRADFITMLVRTLKLGAEITDNFDDIPKSAYYYEPVAIAKKLGITTGTGNNKFSPTAYISRQDMMVQVYRALKQVGYPLEQASIDELNKYEDANQISDYAKEAIAALTKNGIVNGTGKGINPKGLTNRAEVAKILANFVGYIKY